MTDWREWRARLLRASGIYRRRLQRRPFDGVAILAYHGVRDDSLPRSAMQGAELHVGARRLAEHCEVLRELCTPITAAQFLAAARDGRPLPPRAVLLTFDDGYASWRSHALPMLERFEVPAVMFLCTDPIARGVRFWFDAVAEQQGPAAVAAMKRLPYAAWRAAAGRCEMAARPGDPHAPLTVDDVRALASSPLVELGGHTVTHPILANASAAEQQVEVEGCARAIAAWTGTPPRLFAYPNGRPGVDYSPETVSLVRATFDDAFAVGDAFACPPRHAGEHRRFLMLDSVSGAELAHRLAGAWRRTGAVA
ncbi:MAG: polysaccharide deacetylase family protein [Alphaproteobacteria bacterium]